MPPTGPINHYTRPQTNKRPNVLSCYSMLAYSSYPTCFKHSNFFTVTRSAPARSRSLGPQPAALSGQRDSVQSCDSPRPVAPPSTTSFLTATTLIYAIGAGITAAAGTRLALQLLLAIAFISRSFQLPSLTALHCYLLSLPPCVRIG